MDDIFTIIRASLLIVSAIFILLAALGILRFKDDLERVLYARIHILGVADMACILALLVLGEPLLAGAYFILAPFASHAMANGFFYGEDKQ
ncbi:cation:proton antiporter [Methanobacterium sp. CWC-01]|uniref:monovalent cation/H(+) antiporter subunit G n=1 Tax=Methanobacterium aridiramus TaxID=2584467 RepID=UPI0025759F10|nr:monovalent cation/H(+) antiporter subunit G [Methanobacterium sp. CWC-01]WJI09650.1 cation:proton antiporter [Methanobacterium sp. CWC-01]